MVANSTNIILYLHYFLIYLYSRIYNIQRKKVKAFCLVLSILLDTCYPSTMTLDLAVLYALADGLSANMRQAESWWPFAYWDVLLDYCSKIAIQRISSLIRFCSQFEIKPHLRWRRPLLMYHFNGVIMAIKKKSAYLLNMKGLLGLEP